MPRVSRGKVANNSVSSEHVPSKPSKPLHRVAWHKVVRLKDTSQSTACPKTRLQALAATELKAPGSCNSSNVPLGDSDDCTQTVANGHIVGSTIRLTHHRIALIHHNLLHGTPTIVGLPGGQTVHSQNYARPTTI